MHRENVVNMQQVYYASPGPRALSTDLTLHLLIYPRLRPLSKTGDSGAARADVAGLPAAAPASAAAMLGT
jgi:hypothetical protein